MKVKFVKSSYEKFYDLTVSGFFIGSEYGYSPFNCRSLIRLFLLAPNRLFSFECYEGSTLYNVLNISVVSFPVGTYFKIFPDGSYEFSNDLSTYNDFLQLRKER